LLISEKSEKKKMNFHSENSGIVFMPGGTPAPEVMLESELIKFLRLDVLGVKNPAGTLRYYREKGKLRATKIGGYNIYTKADALEFLRHLTKNNGENT